jgi:hypothetical protein
VLSWARAGFSFVVNDGEHSQLRGRMGREQNAALLRAGVTPIQRLHREAVSEHGDALCMGARGTMRPYASSVAEVDEYLRAVAFPAVGAATRADRGGFPVRLGDRQMCFTPGMLRAAEAQTQGWVQFETAELIGVGDTAVRDAVLRRMAAQGPRRAVGFVGPFDALLRGGPSAALDAALAALPKAAAAHGIAMGRVCGSGTCSAPEQIEEAIVRALEDGYRIIAVHWLTSDLPYEGAKAAAAPFFRACERAGRSSESARARKVQKR